MLTPLIEYFLPFQQLLNDIATFQVDSQVLYYTKSSVLPKYNESSQYYWIAEDDLPVFVNAAEWNLESASVSDQSIYFNFFVPAKQPLYLIHKDGNMTDFFNELSCLTHLHRLEDA